MARVTVRVPGMLARYTGGSTSVTLDAATVDGCVDTLVAEFPGLRQHLFDGDGDLREHLQLFVDGQRVRSTDGLLALEDGAEVDVVQAVSGG